MSAIRNYFFMKRVIPFYAKASLCQSSCTGKSTDLFLLHFDFLMVDMNCLLERKQRDEDVEFRCSNIEKKV